MAQVLSASFGASGLLCLFVLVSRASTEAASPVNDAFANRVALSGLTNLVQASNVGATREPGEPTHAGTTGGSSVWWSWTAPASGTVSVSTEGSSFDTLLGIYRGTNLGTLAPIVANDDSPSNTTSTLFFRAIADETYQIAVDGFQGATGNITLRSKPSGYPQPPWNFPDFRSTNRISFADFRNKVVLLDFWESRCEACREESTILGYLRSIYYREGFEIVAVSKDQSLADVYYAVRDLHINYPVLINDPAVEDKFGLGFIYVPTKFLIDRDGKIQTRIEGGNTLEFYSGLIGPLLRGSSIMNLAVRAEPGQVRLSWPGNEFGWIVETANRPIGAPWVQLTTSDPDSAPTVFQTNNEHSITFTTTDQARFYRLRKP